MVDGDIDVEDVAVLEDTLVGNAVADDLVGRRAYGLGEVAVVQRRGITLFKVSSSIPEYGRGPLMLTSLSKEALCTISSM